MPSRFLRPTLAVGTLLVVCFVHPFADVRAKTANFSHFVAIGVQRDDSNASNGRGVETDFGVDANSNGARFASDDAAFYGRRVFALLADSVEKSEFGRFAEDAATRFGIYFRFFGNFSRRFFACKISRRICFKILR